MQVVKNEKRPTPDKVEEQLLLLIEKLTMEQLYEINGIIVDRIKYLEKVKDLKAANAFRRGNKVSWERDGVEYFGVVVKVNQKTINVAENTPPYRQWKISPHYLKKIQ
jgi:hypothetical protein